MVLSCAVIKRDSVSLFKFPLFSHVQVISCEIFPVCHLKYLCNCFSFYFCFLDVVALLFVLRLTLLLLVAVVILCSFSRKMLLLLSICWCSVTSSLRVKGK